MKKFCILLFVLMVFLCGAGSAFSADYVEGEVLVTLEVPQSAMSVAASDMSVFANSLSLQADSFATSVGAEAVQTYAEIARSSGKNIIHLRSDSKTTEQLMNELKNDPRVKNVMPNYIQRALALPDDPGYTQGLLWGMTKIGADTVWNVGGTGSKNVVVAVVDSGIDYNHPDIAANMVKDSNGGYGWSAFGSDPMDDHSHGTHVAGTIGAVGNNGVGVVGVNWKVGLLAVKVLAANNYGSSAGIIGGLDYVAGENRNGPLAGKIKVVNMSLGGWWDKSFESNSVYHTAFDTLGSLGVLVVVSAGNENQNLENPTGSDKDGPYSGRLPFPAVVHRPNTITVGATDAQDARSSFSNYSPKYVHIAAPGSGIWSTFPTSKGSYGTMSGTSMAAPHVAGSAALLFAKYPNETVAQIKARILDYSDANGANFWSNGRLNVKKAYDQGVIADPIVTSVTVSPKTASVVAGSTVPLTAVVAPSTDTQGVTWSSSDPSKASVNASTGVVTGIQAGTSVTITATSIGKDANNASKTDTSTVTVTNTSSSSGGGCNAAPGLMFAILLAVPAAVLILRKRK